MPNVYNTAMCSILVMLWNVEYATECSTDSHLLHPLMPFHPFNYLSKCSSGFAVTTLERAHAAITFTACTKVINCQNEYG